MNPGSGLARTPNRPRPACHRWLRQVVYCLFAGTVLQATDRPGPPASAEPDPGFTFAVLGDNRGDDTGRLAPAFLEIIRAIGEAAPALVLNTGDMIYGHTTDAARVRDQWQRYRAAISEFRAPVFHVPGNHDIWGRASARQYRELWGPTWFALDHANARFIGLDTETDAGRVGTKQFRWLQQQLEQAGPRMVFVFLHRPLFPVDGALGSSLDAHPSARDALHRLFVKHRESIRAVFVGHEHGYDFQERDGVPYYITGGGGAELYLPPELGGFHHFLLVRVRAQSASVELRKVGAPFPAHQSPRRIRSGESLESWEQGWFWSAWDYTVNLAITSDHSSDGRRGLELNFDLAQYPWPSLLLSTPAPLDLTRADEIALDVYLPAGLPGGLRLTPRAEAARKHEAPTVRLTPGWNTVRTAMDGTWLPTGDRQRVRALGWTLASTNGSPVRGSVVFDNLRVERTTPATGRFRELAESWERPLLWRTADESVFAEIRPEWVTEGARSLVLWFDLARCRRPVFFARLEAPWDLAGVGSLAMDVYVPGDISGRLSLTLSLRANEAAHAAPAVALKRGWNQVQVPLDERWLPTATRGAAEQVEWTLTSPEHRSLRGWIACDHLHAQP